MWYVYSAHNAECLCITSVKGVGITMGKKCAWACGLFLLAAAVALLWRQSGREEIVTENGQPAGPLTGVTVCLDPGHGGYDGGAVGRDSGTMEKAINLWLAQELQRQMEAQGAQVVLTREKDIALADEGNERKRRDLRARVEAAQGCDVFLSLHMNEYPDRTQSGPQVFYTAGDDRSRLLAGAIQQSMNDALSPARPRSAHAGDYYVLREQELPAVLVECGFLSNAAEEKLLLTKEYRERVAASILSGVIGYLQLANGA